MPEDRYRIPRAILSGLKAGVQEWQTLREKKKQEVMTKALLGLPLNPEEEKFLTFRVPPELTEMGKATEEKRRWEEEMGYKRELLKIKEKPKTIDFQKEKREEIRLRMQIRNEAKKMASKQVWDEESSKFKDVVDEELADEIESERLINYGLTVPETLQKKILAKKATRERLEAIKPGFTPQEFSASPMIEQLFIAAEHGNLEAYKTLKKFKELGMLK